MLYVSNPFLNEVRRHLVHLHAQQVFDLRGEDGDSDTAGESYDNGVGNVLDDGAQTEHTQQNEEDARHEGGDGETLHAVLLDDAIDDDDEGTCRTAYLHLASAEGGNEQSCDDGGDDTFLRRYTAGNTEGDGEGQCNDAHDDSRHEVGHECLLVVVLDGRNHLRLKV